LEDHLISLGLGLALEPRWLPPLIPSCRF